MNSSFVSVIVIGLLFQVFAQDPFHSQLWRQNLQKINEKSRAFELSNYMEKMKSFELADYLSSNAFGDEEDPSRVRADIAKAYLVCSEETGVSPEAILSIKRGAWMEGDRKAKAWVQCVLMENKLMTDQSVFRQDVAFKYLTDFNRRIFEANVDKCLPNKAMPPMEISWQFAKCFQTADPENSLF